MDYAKSTTSSKQIKDAASNAIESIGDPVTVTVTNDSTAPTVSSITTQKADGSYTVGETVDILIAYSEVVTVNTASGSPTLKIETGAPDRDAVYVSGSGTDTLTFRYTVEAGDNTTDLDYHASTPFSLNGATIKDPAGNNADNTLVSAGGSGSIGQANAIVIDAIVPTITAQTSTAGTTSIALTISEAVTGTPDASDFTVLVNGAANTVTAASISGTSGTLTLTDVIPNSATVTVDYAKSTTNSKQIKDAASNAIESIGDPVSVSVTNDITRPTVISVGTNSLDGTYSDNSNINIEVTFSEVVVVTGTPNITLETGASDAVVNYSSGSQTDKLIFIYTVAENEVSDDLQYSSTNALIFNDGTIKDPANNLSILTLPALDNVNSLGGGYDLIIA